MSPFWAFEDVGDHGLWLLEGKAVCSVSSEGVEGGISCIRGRYEARPSLSLDPEIICSLVTPAEECSCVALCANVVWFRGRKEVIGVLVEEVARSLL
jgi:hypothetical protein